MNDTLMENTAAAGLAPNPYIINLHQLGKLVFFMLLAGILIALLIKIILDLRKYHYKD